jgi:hypothetical protein
MGEWCIFAQDQYGNIPHNHDNDYNSGWLQGKNEWIENCAITQVAGRPG